jgi:hypothetical protein
MCFTHPLFCVVPDFFPAAGKGRPAAVYHRVGSGSYTLLMFLVFAIPLQGSHATEISVDGNALFLTYIVPMALTHHFTCTIFRVSGFQIY